MFAEAQGAVVVMPEVVWETQILLTKCQVQFCLLRKTKEDKEVPFLAKVGGREGRGRAKGGREGASLLA